MEYKQVGWSRLQIRLIAWLNPLEGPSSGTVSERIINHVIFMILVYPEGV
jgi:hypothetical protein